MNKIVQLIFKNKKVNVHKLSEYGFERFDDVYLYKTEVVNGQFEMTVKVSNSDVDAVLVDVSTDEPYTLFLADNAVGGFVGSVRSAYEEALQDIADKCFDKCVFKTEYATQIINYVSQKYGDELEYLWNKFPDNAIWRRKDNRKWYGALLTATKDKLGLKSTERFEMLDVRGDAERLADGVKFFKGYHMNKKSWITVILDGSVQLEEIYRLLDESYRLAEKK